MYHVIADMQTYSSHQPLIFFFLAYVRTKGRRKTVKQLEESAELLRAESDYLEDEIEYLLGYITRYVCSASLYANYSVSS